MDSTKAWVGYPSNRLKMMATVKLWRVAIRIASQVVCHGKEERTWVGGRRKGEEGA